MLSDLRFKSILFEKLNDLLCVFIQARVHFLPENIVYIYLHKYDNICLTQLSVVADDVADIFVSLISGGSNGVEFLGDGSKPRSHRFWPRPRDALASFSCILASWPQ